MIEHLVITALPILFLIVLFGSGEMFRRKNIDMDGEPPIDKTLFYVSKYTIVVLWIVMILTAWGINPPFIRRPVSVKWISLGLWVFGFLLLFSGRFKLGNSFRLGSPQESTSLKLDGLYRFSRHPMYLGVYSTVLATSLYTMNPVFLFLALAVIKIHHKIVVAEEWHLLKEFGEEYKNYCSRVRRYI